MSDSIPNNKLPDNVIQLNPTDFSRRFLFENMDVRGEWLHFEQGLDAILQQHQYPEDVSHYLAEFVLAAVLLNSCVKINGRLSLQLQGAEAISLLMAECNSQHQVRALARFNAEVFAGVEPLRFQQAFAGATLAITIEPAQGERYQGLVPLTGSNLAECLAFYFQQSEQLASHFYFAVEKTAQGNYRGAAFMLQQLPVSQKQKVIALEDREEQWNYVSQLVNTLKPDEMFDTSVEELLHRLFHEDDLRLFDAQPIHFSCPCSREKYRSALLSLGQQALQEIIQEQGAVKTQCEFCSAEYEFKQEDLEGF